MKKIILVVIIAMMLASSVLAKGLIVYPANCDTDVKKLAYLSEFKKKIIAWHNKQTANMTPEQAHAFFNKHFMTIVIEVEDEINTYQKFVLQPDGTYLKNVPEAPEIPVWNPDISIVNSVNKKVDIKPGG